MSAVSLESQRSKGGILAVGIIAIVVGGFAALAVLISLFVVAARLPAWAETDRAALAGVFLPEWLYAVGAVSLIWLGIGTVRVRRWAWALMLALSWVWLLLSTLMTVSLISAMVAGAIGRAEAVVAGFAVAVGAVFFIGLPLAFILVLGRAQVRQAFVELDPLPRWTDRAPVSVLGTSAFLVGAVPILLLLALAGAPLAHLEGSSAALGWTMLAIVVGVCAVGLWRGLGIALVVVAALWLGAAIAIGHEILASSVRWPLALVIVYAVAGLGFLVRLRTRGRKLP